MEYRNGLKQIQIVLNNLSPDVPLFQQNSPQVSQILNKNMHETRKSSYGKLQQAHCQWCNLSKHNLSRGGVPQSWPGVTPVLAGREPLSWGTPLGRDLGPVTRVPAWKGTWDQSLGYPPGRDLGPVTWVWEYQSPARTGLPL